jgi:hypothetical protein
MTVHSAATTPEAAILWADLVPALFEQPAGLVPLLGKPLLLRAVERLVEHGCKEIFVLLGENAGEVRSLLGDGERWGCHITCHYLDPQATLSGQLRAVGVGTSGHYWLADASQVPAEALPVDVRQSAAGLLLTWQDGDRQRWNGWGRFMGAWLLAQNLPPAQALAPERLLADPWLVSKQTSAPLASISPTALLDSARRLLDTASSAARCQPATDSQIAPDAQLILPVHLGRGIKIGAGAVVGPNVVIEDGAFIDRDTHLCNSIVLPETYVGRELDLDGVVAGPGLLANTRLDTITEVRDPDLLAALASPAGKVPLATRALAGLLRITLSPLYLWLNGRATHSNASLQVTLPCPRTGSDEPGQIQAQIELPAPLPGKVAQGWGRHFCLSFYPGLRHVMRGELRLIGPSLRTRHEVRQLPDEWRRLYADSRCGLLNEGLLLDAAPLGDEAFASDALAAAQPDSASAALKLVIRYLRKISTSLRQEDHASRDAATDLHPEDAA